MLTHIPIPDDRISWLALSVMILGSFHFQIRRTAVEGNLPFPWIAFHAWTKTGMVVLAAAVLPLGSLFIGNGVRLLAIPIAVVLGWVFFELEIAGMKRVIRWRRAQFRTAIAPVSFRLYQQPNTWWARARYYLPFVCVAGAEEMLFTGCLTTILLSLQPLPWVLIPLAGVNLLFALSHLSLGLWQVLSKSGLAAISLALFFFTGCLYSSMAFHAVFNLCVARAALRGDDFV